MKIKHHKNEFFFVIFTLLFLLQNCSTKKNELIWNKTLYKIGSQSSPRSTDLNSDGILDIVIGAGKNEFQSSEQGVLAFDGKNGNLLWQQDATDQVFGSATFYDITGDGIDDVFIGGRTPNFKALNGKNGEVIWKYDYIKYDQDPIAHYARFNFYNSILIPDQNDDDVLDLLTVNGGNSSVAAYSEKDRSPGVLMIIDSKSGEIIQADTMPDGKESYMSPICFVQPGTIDHTIIFGSGGETIKGNLYQILLSDFMDSGLEKVKTLASEIGYGFIAPPVVADITRDGLLDIVAISLASTVFAIDGSDNSIIWENKIENAQTSTSFGVGFFTDDNIPDFFTTVMSGPGTIQIMLDGKSGKVAYSDTTSFTGTASPVIYDLNNDGYDEAILSINEFENGSVVNKLVAIDFKKESIFIIDQMQGFKNIFTTPWIGDLDNDAYLDIVYCQYFSPNTDVLAFLGMKVKRISTNIKVRKDPVWGAYMGSKGDGVFPLK